MTLGLTDIADALRWVLFAAALVWIVYAWLHRVEYRLAVLLLAALVASAYLIQAFAAYAEEPDSHIPSEFPLFTILILLAGMAGVCASFLHARHLPVLDAALFATILGGIGGRAYFVWMHWEYYSQNPDHIANVSQGGMGMRGALAFGLIALYVFARIRRVSFWQLADAAVIGIALAQSIGWYAAHRVGINYGAVSDSTFAQDLPDAYGIIAPRLPVQLIASACFFGLFVALAWRHWQRKDRPGLLFLIYLVTSGLLNFMLGYFRGDETLVWNGLRVDQIADLMFVTIGLLLYAVRWLSPMREQARPMILK